MKTEATKREEQQESAFFHPNMANIPSMSDFNLEPNKNDSEEDEKAKIFLRKFRNCAESGQQDAQLEASGLSFLKYVFEQHPDESTSGISDAIKTITHEAKEAHFLDESQKQLIKEAMTMALAESKLVYSEGEKKQLFEQFVSIAEHGLSATRTRRNL